MSSNKRFNELRKIPPFAALDHRFFLDDAGNDSRLNTLSRKERRQLKAQSRKIGEKYSRVLGDIAKSGAGYPIDKLLRTFAIEYTHRYAASGVTTQPANFNYFEAFCAIKLFSGSVAPYAEPRPELDHLFSVPDFFDYLTDKNAPNFSLEELRLLPEGVVHNFTQNGVIGEFTYLTAEGREFVVSGFSMVRHENAIHWSVLGGEVLSDTEWQERCDSSFQLNSDAIPPEKRPFLTQAVQETNSNSGSPMALEGTKSAVRTIIAGETDLDLGKHVSRCHMTELENSFMLFCDDPDVFSSIRDAGERNQMIAHMRQRVESAAVMWNLAEAFFQLPSYFRFRLTVPKGVVQSSGLPGPKTPKGGQGIGAHYKHVTALETSDLKNSVVRVYTSPHLAVDTEGYWRRLEPNANGTDRQGKPVAGRTWVKATNEWRARPDEQRTVYIKSSVAAAKMRVSQYLKAAGRPDHQPASEKTGVLYVMRCVAMQEEVYKVGWTSKSADLRAQELSSATGVPTAFAVVESWQHPDPEGLEKGVHAMLTPYRLSEGREFFKLQYPELKNIIEAEIRRTQHRSGQT